MPELIRAAVRVPLVLAQRAGRRESAGKRGVDLLAWRRDVVVDAVAVRELRHVARGTERAHPEHMRQRCRIACEGPRRLRRVVRVADRRAQAGATADGVTYRAPRP